MDPDRRKAAEATARLGLRWIWAHELAHLVLGHTEVQGEAEDLALSVDHLAEARKESEAFTLGLPLALELLADRFAWRLVLNSLPKASQSYPVLTMIGIALSLTLFDAPYLIARTQRRTTTHPGAWLRLRALLDDTDLAALDPVWRDAFLSGLTQQGGHCTQWVANAVDPAFAPPARAFFDELDRLQQPFEDRLRASSASLVTCEG
jgi:hypothetical protein